MYCSSCCQARFYWAASCMFHIALKCTLNRANATGWHLGFDDCCSNVYQHNSLAHKLIIVMDWVVCQSGKDAVWMRGWVGVGTRALITVIETNKHRAKSNPICSSFQSFTFSRSLLCTGNQHWKYTVQLYLLLILQYKCHTLMIW